MRLIWISEDEIQRDAFKGHQEYRVGYWHAQTDKSGFDGTGPDPLTAMSNLAAGMERHLGEHDDD